MRRQDLYFNSIMSDWIKLLLGAGLSSVAQSVERPKGPSLVQLYLTDVGSNPKMDISLCRGIRW